MRLNKTLLLTTTMIAGVAAATAAAAQTTPSTQTPTAVAQSQATPAAQDKVDNATQVEGVIVTGSRIVRKNLDQPAPVSTLSPQVIQNAGTANLGDIIALLPSVGFTGTVRSNSNNFGNGAGLNQINLRDLGISRTLVLVDGQRHVAGDISNNAVDVNSIPSALVDHVEVVTGGASAIYGSDAVTGVVNIILKKKFEGVEASISAGGYDNGFGANYNAYATVGHNFDFGDHHLNITATGYYTSEAGIDARNIPSAHNYGTIANPNDLPAGTFDPTFYSSGAPITNDGIPDRLYVQNVGSDLVSRGGALIDYVALATTGKLQPVLQFDAAGRPIAPLVRSGYNSSAFAQLPANCGVACYFTEDYEQLRTPLETKGADFTAHYDQNPHLHFSLDAKYAESDAVNVIQPSFSFGDYQLQDDNAFITPEIRAALAANRAAAAALVGPDDASLLNPLIGKFINNGRSEDVKRQTYRFVFGVNGDFDARLAQINWSGALNYGETDTRFNNKNLVITQNFAAALDSVINPATGQPACRVNVPSAAAGGLPYGETPFNAASCVPFSPFGTTNSAAVQNYISGSYVTRDKLSQQVATLNANADSSRFFNFQGGPVAVAVGAEYRMERTRETNDAFVVAGNTENLSSNSAGGFNVYEGYIEAEAPFFKHAGPWLDEVRLDAAYRGSYYSTVGHTDAYKFSGIYGPFRDIKFRATYSRAVRAPNITEAFLPPSGGFFNVSDPCDATNILSNVNYAKNCAAAGIPAGFTSSTNASITGLTSGNPGLDPEKSISYTGGFIIQPRWVPRLSVTIDYYAIKIKNAITNVSAQDIINNCYSGTVLDPQYCGLFTRGADKNINFVQTTYVNASKIETDGIDLTANYSVGVAGLTSRWDYSRFLDGRLSFDLNANYVIHLRNFPFQNIPDQVHILEGTSVDPKLKALLGITYQQGALQVAWQTRYLGRTTNFSRDAEAADHSESTDIPFNKPTFVHNLVVRYDLPGPMLRGGQVYGGVNNIFGEQPPGYLLGTLNDVGYDLGRYLFLGVKFRR